MDPGRVLGGRGGVGSATHPLAAADVVDVGELRGQRWIATPSTDDQPRLGVWPGLDERPDIAHSVRDWMAKLNLVAAGCGVTTLPGSLVAAVPPGVRVLTVRGGPHEQRRILLARLPRPLTEPAARLADALRTAIAEPDPSS